MCAGRGCRAPHGEGEAGWLPVPLRRVAIRRRGARTGECGGRGISHLGRELAADLGQRALLGLVEDREGALHARGVLGEEPVDQLLAEAGEGDGRRAAVVREAAADDEPAVLERRDDLGGVGLRGLKATAQRAQLHLPAGRREDDEDAEARGAQALALEVGGQAPPDARLGAQQRVQRAVGERITGHERHRADMMPGGADGGWGGPDPTDVQLSRFRLRIFGPRPIAGSWTSPLTSLAWPVAWSSCCPPYAACAPRTPRWRPPAPSSAPPRWSCASCASATPARSPACVAATTTSSTLCAGASVSRSACCARPSRAPVRSSIATRASRSWSPRSPRLSSASSASCAASTAARASSAAEPAAESPPWPPGACAARHRAGTGAAAPLVLPRPRAARAA